MLLRETGGREVWSGEKPAVMVEVLRCAIGACDPGGARRPAAATAFVPPARG